MKLTIFQIILAFNQQNRNKNHKRHTWLLMWHILVFTHSVLHRILIGHAHTSQFTEWQNLGITTPKHTTCALNVFLKLLENQITTNFIYLTSSNFVTISHINYWDQVNSWKNLWKFWNGSLCRNKSGPSPVLNVAVYWKSSNTEACAKKLPQILGNNIDNGGRGIALRIYVRYCRLSLVHFLFILKCLIDLTPYQYEMLF